MCCSTGSSSKGNVLAPAQLYLNVRHNPKGCTKWHHQVLYEPQTGFTFPLCSVRLPQVAPLSSSSDLFVPPSTEAMPCLLSHLPQSRQFLGFSCFFSLCVEISHAPHSAWCFCWSLPVVDSPRPRFGTTKRAVSSCQGDGAAQPWVNPCRTIQELHTCGGRRQRDTTCGCA